MKSRVIYLIAALLCAYVLGYLHGAWRMERHLDKNGAAEIWWNRYRGAESRAIREAIRADSLQVELYNARRHSE